MDLLAPSSVDGTILLVPIAAALGSLYGFVGRVGYSKEVSAPDPKRSRAASIGCVVAIFLVIFFRHIVNGQAADGLQRWFQQTLHQLDSILGLLLAFPLTIGVILAGLVIMIGGFLGGAVAIGALLYYLPGFVMGLPIVFNWFFVKHAAEPIVSSALEKGRELETSNLREALTPRPSDLALSKPVYHYEHQAEKARALAAKLNHDAHVAEAAMRRERARAALKEAEQELRDVERRGTRGHHE
jgi:hypothetical protein